VPPAFSDRLAAAIHRLRTPAVVGIDPVLQRLPAPLRERVRSAATAAAAFEEFGRGVIDAVAERVPAVKINSAFFESCYEHGVAAYYRLVAYAHARGLLVIGDIKRGDIGSTSQAYARGHFADPEWAGEAPDRIPDAVTLAAYLGRSVVDAFLEAAAAAGRGVYVLVRPSDPAADEIHEFGADQRLYQHLAALVSAWGAAPGRIGESGYSCVGAVVAPKDRASTARLRAALPHTPLLVPGYGAQGAGAADCAACFSPRGDGALVNASRSVIYAFDPSAGGDWQSPVAAAAEAFARDVAGCAELARAAQPRP